MAHLAIFGPGICLCRGVWSSNHCLCEGPVGESFAALLGAARPSFRLLGYMVYSRDLLFLG